MSNECPRCGSKYTHLNRRFSLWECEDCGHRFEEACAASARLTIADLGRPATRQARIFLSYPHSSRPICVMIRDALRARGHDVWFDDERIRPGDDWRERITDGIDTHRTFVSCLTRDAVREGTGVRGVCLDEISIAVSTPGCVVQSILLEPADLVRPTAAVAHRQWLDMSNWREVRAEGSGRFRAWFSERMLRLLEVVESEESRAFAGEVEEVHKLLPLARWGTGKEVLLRRALVGRTWLAAELEAWMDDPQGGALCALWGDPGVGKSAFAVHYAMESARVAAAVCLSYGDVRYGTMSALAQSVAYQLACRLPDYRAELLRALRGTPVSQVGPSEIADLLFIRPLTFRHVDGGHEAVCVLVDGLDECAECERDAAVALLRRLREGAPHWLRLLVAARPEPDLLAALHPDRELWLRGEGDENMADVAAYLEGNLKGIVPGTDERDGLVHSLAERSQGVFLFAEAVAESARLGGLDISDLSSLPSTLDEALHGWLARAFPDGDEYARRFRHQVGAMLASPTPLPEAELTRLLGASESDVGDVRLRAGSLLERGEDDFGESTLSVSHRYVAEWLSSEKSGRFRAYRREALRTMACGCHRIAASDPDSLTGYEAANAIELCEAAGLVEQTRELCRNRGLAVRLIDCGDWLDTWGRQARAGELHGLALEIFEALASELGTYEARRDLSVSLGRTGLVAHARGDLDGAGVAWSRSLAINEALASELGTYEARRDLSMSLGRLGDLAQERGDLAAADEAYGCSLAIREALASELGTPEARRDLCTSLDRLGDLARMRGDLAAAGNVWSRSLVMRNALAAELGTPEAMSELATSLGRVGDIAFERGDLDVAGDAWSRSMKTFKVLVSVLGTPMARRNLSLSLERLGDLARARGDLDAAGDALSRSLEIDEALASELGTPKARRDFSVSLEKVGDLAQDRGDLDAASDIYGRSLAIREALASELATPETMRDLALSLGRIGDIAFERGDLDAVGDAWSRSMEIHEALASELNTPQARREYAALLSKIGILEHEQSHDKRSLDHLTRALAVFTELDNELHTPQSTMDLRIVTNFISMFS